MEIDLPSGEKHIVSSKTLTPEFMRSFRGEAERLAAEREAQRSTESQHNGEQ